MKQKQMKKAKHVSCEYSLSNFIKTCKQLGKCGASISNDKKLDSKTTYHGKGFYTVSLKKPLKAGEWGYIKVKCDD